MFDRVRLGLLQLASHNIIPENGYEFPGRMEGLRRNCFVGRGGGGGGGGGEEEEDNE